MSTKNKIVSREKILSRVAAKGDVKMLEHFQLSGLVSCAKEISLEAASNGRVEFLKYLKSKKLLSRKHALKGSVISGDILLYLKYERGHLNNHLKEAAKYGSLAILKYLSVNRGYTVGNKIYHEAVRHGKMNVAEWIEKKHQEVTAPCFEVTDAATDSGSIEMIKHVISRGNVMKRREYLRAFSLGHLDAFIYLLELSKEKNYIEDTYIVEVIRKGHLSCLSYAIENRFLSTHINNEHYITALISGELEIVKYLRSIKCPLPSDIAYYATKGGNVQLLKYEVEMGSVPDEFVMVSAIEKESLKMVSYLLSIGCPIPPNIVDFCKKKGQNHLVHLFE